jgi:hypothetical protein
VFFNGIFSEQRLLFPAPIARSFRLALVMQLLQQGAEAADLLMPEGAACGGLALVADAKDDNATAFYQHHGFQRFASKPKPLFLPLGTAKKGAAH